jgi:hypothetical protein
VEQATYVIYSQFDPLDDGEKSPRRDPFGSLVRPRSNHRERKLLEEGRWAVEVCMSSCSMHVGVDRSEYATLTEVGQIRNVVKDKCNHNLLFHTLQEPFGFLRAKS